jgi:hypothetical protein
MISLQFFTLNTSNPTDLDEKNAISYEIVDNLADTIKKSIDAISSWSTSELIALGIMLGTHTVEDLESYIITSGNQNYWPGIIRGRHYADLYGYNSLAIDNEVKRALDGYLMFSNYSVPLSRPADNHMSLWDQYTLLGFNYAIELNYSTDKWDPFSAYQGLKNCRDTIGRAFYACNPDTNQTWALFNTRWMSTSNLASSFMRLYELTNDTRMLDSALQEWDDLNRYYWSPSKKGYDYSRKWRTWEWSTLEVFFNYDRLRKLNGSLNLFDRIYIDAMHRYLTLSWNSPQWKNKVVAHSEGASQRRLHATADAWQILLTYFGYFPDSIQQNMKSMLEGTYDLPAWEALLNSNAGLYFPSTGLFQYDSNSLGPTDGATTEGILTLFLLGVSPQNGGGLILPKRIVGYSGGYFPADRLRFWYNEQKIMLPIYANTTLKFLYGDLNPEYEFAEHGLYNITFSLDWNSVTNVDLVKSIEVDPKDVPIQLTSLDPPNATYSTTTTTYSTTTTPTTTATTPTVTTPTTTTASSTYETTTVFSTSKQSSTGNSQSKNNDSSFQILWPQLVVIFLIASLMQRRKGSW